jgi:hypothetical protein
MEGALHPASYDTRCRDCAAGRERAREEEIVRKKKQETAGGARHLPGLVWEDPATWRILLGPRLADEFFEAAGRDPVAHLRNIVAEYYYLESIGA